MKLWNILQESLDNGTYELTFGASDPVVVAEMAKQQKNIYVSGYACGLTEDAEPGIKQANYPWDTIPKVIAKISSSQMWNEEVYH